MHLKPVLKYIKDINNFIYNIYVYINSTIISIRCTFNQGGFHLNKLIKKINP